MNLSQVKLRAALLAADDGYCEAGAGLGSRVEHKSGRSSTVPPGNAVMAVHGVQNKPSFFEQVRAAVLRLSNH